MRGWKEMGHTCQCRVFGECSRAPGFQRQIWKRWSFSLQLLCNCRHRERMREPTEMGIRKTRKEHPVGLEPHINRFKSIHKKWILISLLIRNGFWCAIRSMAAEHLESKAGEVETRNTCSWARLRSQCFILSSSQEKQEPFMAFRTVIYILTLLLHYAAV